VILDKPGMTIFDETSMNLRLSFAALLLVVPSAFGATDTNTVPAQPESAAPVAAPAFVEEVTFNVVSAGDKQRISVISAPGLVRVDSPDDRLSVLYDPATEHYTGLEHSNYTYWEFSWPEVRDAVENTPRYASRLRDLGPELLEENAIAPPATNSDSASADASTAPPTASAGGDDNSGYVWHTDTARKRVAGIDCVHWIGETVSGEQIDAWCAPRPIPEVENALAILKTMNEPMALVPVRTLLPPLVFVAWQALQKGGVTPVMLTWGSDTAFNQLTLAGIKQREGKLAYFQVPRLYVKTTLVTMDGIGNQKAQGTHREVPGLPPATPLLNKP